MWGEAPRSKGSRRKVAGSKERERESRQDSASASKTRLAPGSRIQNTLPIIHTHGKNERQAKRTLRRLRSTARPTVEKAASSDG